MVPPRRYQSWLFKTLDRQVRHWRDRATVGLRYVQVTVHWGAELLLHTLANAWKVSKGQVHIGLGSKGGNWDRTLESPGSSPEAPPSLLLPKLSQEKLGPPAQRTQIPPLLPQNLRTALQQRAEADWIKTLQFLDVSVAFLEQNLPPALPPALETGWKILDRELFGKWIPPLPPLPWTQETGWRENDPQDSGEGPQPPELSSPASAPDSAQTWLTGSNAEIPMAPAMPVASSPIISPVSVAKVSRTTQALVAPELFTTSAVAPRPVSPIAPPTPISPSLSSDFSSDCTSSTPTLSPASPPAQGLRGNDLTGQSPQRSQWIDIESVSVSYEKHPLEQGLHWLDQVMLGLEKIGGMIWRWCQQIIGPWRKQRKGSP
jgi:hypothetical protein